jgi:hypothetical protein
MGMDFTSTINNGDTIEFKYNGDDEIARPREILNKTTGASVAAVRDARAIGRKRQLSGALIFVIFLALVTLPILALILGRLGAGLRRVNPQPAPSIQLGNWCPQGQKQIVVNGQTACVKQ